MATLKVYRTPIGFHDAYVAAPSKKAALRAWGSDKDLFARGMAEIVTDAELIAAPLEQPGVVIKRSRGTAAEQIAALPPDRPRRAAPAKKEAKAASPARKPTPRPDRSTLDAAERELASLEKSQSTERREIEARLAVVQRERDALLRNQAERRAAAEEAREQAAGAYDQAIREWRG